MVGRVDLRIYGGEPIERQLRALSRGVDIVVGTPAASSTTFSDGRCTLGDIFHVVLDEADRMLDIGFRPDIERILKKVPDPHQTLLLSATISPGGPQAGPQVHVRAGRAEPVARRAVGRVDSAVLHHGDSGSQDRAAGSPAASGTSRRQCIIFTRTKRGADKLADRLRGKVRGVATIHGDMPQSARNRVMQGFRDGTIPRPGRDRRRGPRH